MKDERTQYVYECTLVHFLLRERFWRTCWLTYFHIFPEMSFYVCGASHVVRNKHNSLVSIRTCWILFTCQILSQPVVYLRFYCRKTVCQFHLTITIYGSYRVIYHHILYGYMITSTMSSSRVGYSLMVAHDCPLDRHLWALGRTGQNSSSSSNPRQQTLLLDLNYGYNHWEEI